MTGQLSDFARNGHLSHAYLLVGPDLSLADQAIKDLLYVLVCPQAQKTSQACHECRLCQKVTAGSLADVLTIVPDGRAIKVDQIRQLREWLNRSPMEVDFKLAFIREADSMNDAAANALLKVLEEPPSQTYLILGAKDSHGLLATIRSRVQTLVLSANGPQAQIDHLGQPWDTFYQALPLSSQAALATIEADELGRWFDVYYKLFSLCYARDDRAFVYIQTKMKPFLNQQQLLAGIDFWQLLLSQLIATMTQAQSQVNASPVRDLMKGQQVQVQDLVDIQTAIIQAKQYLKANVTPQMVVERLVLSLIQ